MSDGIWYEGKYLGSVHYFVYKQGQLPGNPNGLYVRLTNFDSLETLLKLAEGDQLRVGEEDMTIRKFKEEVLENTNHIGFEGCLHAPDIYLTPKTWWKKLVPNLSEARHGE